MARFSHKDILFYGDGKKYSTFRYKDVFLEIAGLRTSFGAVRRAIDEYVTLILEFAGSPWRDEIERSGAEHFWEIEKRVNVLLDIPQADAAGRKAKRDILPDLLISSSGGNYFAAAWNEYCANALEEKLPGYFDLPSADRLHREIKAVAGAKNADAVFTMLWHTFYNCSYEEAFLKGFLDGITSSLLSVECDTADRVWQIWLDNF